VSAIQAQQSPTLVSRAQVTITPENADRVHLMEIDLTHGTYVPGRFLITDLTDRQISLIRSLGFEVEVLIEDVTAHYQERQPQRAPLDCQEYNFDYPVPRNFEFGSMGGYLKYSELIDALDLMQLLYPELISTRQRVGTEVTAQGRPLYWVRISDNASTQEPEPSVLYTGLHHAREPMSMMQMIYFMWHLLEGYGVDPEATYLLNNTELYFIPCVNPDGYIYNQTIAPNGGGHWRKNMRDNDNSGAFEEDKDGVDLNRNYGYHWGLDDLGSSPNMASEVYRGKSAFSEPETRAIKGFVEEHNFFAALNYHAYGNVFIYPWGYTEEINPDIGAFQNYGELFTLDNRFKIGTSVETVGYPTNGSSDDWMYGDHGVFAMTPEVGEDFWPHQSQIIELAQSSLKNNIAMAHLPLEYALATEINRGFFIGKEGTLDIRIKRYGMGIGDMALTAMSLSPELYVDGNIFEVAIEQFESLEFSIPYVLNQETKGGDEFSFVVILDNGFFEYRDTVTKVLAGETLAFLEDGEDISEWSATGGSWGITDETSYTGATCFTDSPNGPCKPNQTNYFALTDPIDLIDATYSVLEFWAKWEIEELIDYAQVEISTNGTDYEALCGQYSKLGSVFQLPGPIYDGVQTEWVRESIDLSAYNGEQIYIRFKLVTDGFLNLDGIYIDDVRVYVYKDDLTAVEQPAVGFGEMRVWPNPTSSSLWVSMDDTSFQSGDARLVIINALGAEVQRVVIAPGSDATRIETNGWPSGLYQVCLFQDGRVSATRKVVVE
jgi:hypothetical protein